ncbi:protein ISD11 [Plasmodium gonderi]|uniref:Protein ISD11 n=1 Tax=Plasmodium gonderi TaxID=77519 RepID=A0A1Y1JP47_PLAGO|nr:protein ISD11 [Plasmodium gonderi]GAW83318.1 protein ISD11 [Plasmodium gonderi]
MKTNNIRNMKILYRHILSEASKFENINYNVYFTNKAKETFREFFSSNNNNRSDEKLKEFENNCKEYLNMLRRQTIVHNLYHVDKPLVSK